MMQDQHPNRLIRRSTLCGLMFLIGLVAGITIKDYPLLTFDTSLDLDDILNIVVALFVAYVISTILPKKIQEGRIEKDMAINELNKYLDTLNLTKEEIVDYFTVQNRTQNVDLGRIQLITTKLKLLYKNLVFVRRTLTDFGFQDASNLWDSYNFPQQFADLRGVYCVDILYDWQSFSSGQNTFERHIANIRSIILAVNRD